VAVAGELRDLTPEHFRRVIDVNVLGVVYGTMAAYRVMLRQRTGHIVNISSTVGLLADTAAHRLQRDEARHRRFSSALRIEAESLGVKVSLACPGLVDTQIHVRTEYVNVRKEDFLARLPRQTDGDAEGKAAHAILRGVARNPRPYCLSLERETRLVAASPMSCARRQTHALVRPRVQKAAH